MTSFPLSLQACYLCYSLLTLASVVVGTQVMPSSKQGPLQNLCIQLQQHIGASIREDPCIMYRTELKNLVAQTYVKWQELLSQSWLQPMLERVRFDSEWEMLHGKRVAERGQEVTGVFEIGTCMVFGMVGKR
ncbi:UNVERIFIED_CONTAM: hypothetical protein K2H54_036690 [Gekko kuhli]